MEGINEQFKLHSLLHERGVCKCTLGGMLPGSPGHNSHLEGKKHYCRFPGMLGVSGKCFLQRLKHVPHPPIDFFTGQLILI